MQRLIVRGVPFACRTRPSTPDGRALEAVLSAVAEGSAIAPDLLYWDVGLKDGGRLRFGRGGIDPLLVAGADLSDCIALREGALDAAIAAKAASPEDIVQAVRAIVRSPAFHSVYCPGVVATASASTLSRGGHQARAGNLESLSAAILSDHEDDDLGAALDAVAGQDVTSRLEVLVMISGSAASAGKRRAQAVDDWSAAHRKVRVRRFILWGDFSRAYLANTTMAMAVGEVVAMMDARCLPKGKAMLQTLADWADGADVATVSPRVLHGGRLLAAGLGLHDQPGGQTTVAPVAAHFFSEGLRLCAAPAPWLFATRRRAWIAAGGVHDQGVGLWTASLAGAGGPKGRHLMVGALAAEWVGAAPPEAGAKAAPRKLRPSVDKALRADSVESIGVESIGVQHARLTPDIKPIPSALPQAPQPAAPVRAAFSDATGPGLDMRLLIFADAFGASQAIAFTEGLSKARASGRAGVTVYAEEELKRAGDRLEPALDRAFAEVSPTVVVVSRMADPDLWRAVEAATRKRGLPLLFHIDDDLFEVPFVLGAERYRIARQPKRLHTLHAMLEACDLTLASTEALAQRLRLLASHRRIEVMPIGAAARAHAVRLPSRRNEVVVGYMGSASHNADLAMIAPALNRLTDTTPNVRLTLFGSIAKQPAAKLITGPVTMEPGVFGDYAKFKRRLSELRFDIGLAPLADTPFNRVKTPVKWLEYTEAGAAVLASDVEPYWPMAEVGALVAVADDAWESGLRRLVQDSELRQRLVTRSDMMVRREFDWDRLEMGMIQRLETLALSAAKAA